MKKVVLFAIVMTLLFAVIGCSTLTDVISDTTKGVVKPGGVISGKIDFKDDEILSADNENNLIDNVFFVAKVLTTATADTKNQSEVLYTKDGEKKWSIAVIPSHKASKNELELSRIVLYNYYYKYEDMDEDRYRKQAWYMGRISSVDELFKDVVEVNGKKMQIQWIRIPEIPVE